MHDRNQTVFRTLLETPVWETREQKLDAHTAQIENYQANIGAVVSGAVCVCVCVHTQTVNQSSRARLLKLPRIQSIRPAYIYGKLLGG